MRQNLKITLKSSSFACGTDFILLALFSIIKCTARFTSMNLRRTSDGSPFPKTRLFWYKVLKNIKVLFIMLLLTYWPCKQKMDYNERLTLPKHCTLVHIEIVLFRKQKKRKVVQICKSLTPFISSIYGPSKMIIYRPMITTR